MDLWGEWTRRGRWANPPERFNVEIKRHTKPVDIFPNDAAIACPVGALLLEQSDEWQLQRKGLLLEGQQAVSDNQAVERSAVKT